MAKLMKINVHSASTFVGCMTTAEHNLALLLFTLTSLLLNGVDRVFRESME